jgi:uncharacterized protein YlxW (UPF0749 family)
VKQFRSVKISTMVLMLSAGIAIGATANVAGGTDLRSERSLDLKGLVIQRVNDVESWEARNQDLRTEFNQLINENWSPELIELQQTLTSSKNAAGFSAVSGPGLTVILDDAPYDPQDGSNIDFDPNWLLIHQEDIQVVINALVAGGADAISLMDQRIVAVSDIKCVGSTLLVNGRVYSPPFVIKAVGPIKKMQKSLDNDEAVTFLRDMATTFNLFYGTTPSQRISIPSHSSVPIFQYAKPIE